MATCRIALALLLPVALPVATGLNIAQAGNPKAGIFGYQGRPETRDLLIAGGFGLVRMRQPWADSQYAKPVGCEQFINFYADPDVDRARQDGLDILLTLRGTPGWANNDEDDSFPPLDASYFYNYARAVAQHYCGRVKFFDLWNQPKPTKQYWSGTVKQYRELILKPGIRGVHEGCATAQVVAPSTGSPNGDIDINRWVKEDDGTLIPGIDVYSFHNQSGVTQQLRTLRQMRDWCDRHLLCAAFMLTEFGDDGPSPGQEMVDVLQRCESYPKCLGSVIFYWHAADIETDLRAKALLDVNGLVRNRLCVVEHHNTGQHFAPCPCNDSKPGCAP